MSFQYRLTNGEDLGTRTGWRLGGHVTWFLVQPLEETVDTAIVPKKSEVPVGALRSILSQAHIDPDGWERLG